MNPSRLLRRICSRHGLRPEEAARLLPLVQRALAAPFEVRDRILILVEDNLARKAGREIEPDKERLFADLDEEVLSSVAGVLSDWKPSSKVLGVGEILPGLFPDGFDVDELPD